MPTRRSRGVSPSQEKAAFLLARRYLRRPYVTGVTLGEPIKRGKVQIGQRAICIHVEHKPARRFVPQGHLFPRTVLGVRVDVVERRHRAYELSDEEIFRRQIDRSGPVQPGLAISAPEFGFGTLGMIVFDREDGAPCLLSAAHIFGFAAGCVVLQPSSGASGTRVGVVTRMIADSDGDAAVARIDSDRKIAREFLGLGMTPRQVGRVKLQQQLAKSGARTATTTGVVTSIGEIKVPYRNHGPITMAGFEIRPVDPHDTREISDEGDSGAVWVDATSGDAVGLTVGGDPYGAFDRDEFTLACHVGIVIKRLQVSLDPDDRLRRSASTRRESTSP
jgi:endonuclease G, mitochondrial